MIGILEQTYGRHHHAPANAALIFAVTLEFPEETILFASTAEHRAHVKALRPLPERVKCLDINVPPPGQISFHRFAAQWRAMRAVMRQRPAPRALILLSSGPETFFAARAIATSYPFVVLFIMLHGNLTDAVGWRSRDPRHRLFDYRSGLKVANHPRIKLVVLENYIRSAAVRKGVLRPNDTTVWPNILNETELATETPRWSGCQPLRIAFAGTASRNKGFHHFLELVQATDRREYRFELVGSLSESFPHDASQALEMPAQPLSRSAYIQRLRAIDYVLLPYTEALYELTASGSLLDCLAQMKPVIALDIAGVRELSEEGGEIGFICPSMTAISELLKHKRPLSDPGRYVGFQRNLAAIAASRTPARIAPLIRRDLEQAGVPPLSTISRE